MHGLCFSMQDLAAELERMDDCEEILAYVFAFATERGATAFSYHFYPALESPNSKRTVLHSIGFPPEGVKAYVEEGWLEVDPVPQLTFEHPPTLTWEKARLLSAGDPEARKYFERMREFGVENGVSFSLYGPHARDGYAAMVFERPPDEMPPGLVTLLHGVTQAAHMRICQVTTAQEEAVELSDRELEVLGWMAKGKTSTEMATILEISPDTVRTYTKRLYEKLGVNDRVAAVVSGLRRGLIRL